MNIEHGRYSVLVKNNVITTYLRGSLNEYTVKKMIQELKAHVLERQGAPVFLLVDDLELDGITPEGFAEIDSYNIWLVDKNVVAKAVVTKMDIQKCIDVHWIPNMYSDTHYFNHSKQAWEWLLEKGCVDNSIAKLWEG